MGCSDDVVQGTCLQSPSKENFTRGPRSAATASEHERPTGGKERAAIRTMLVIYRISITISFAWRMHASRDNSDLL